jgi:hypothetical protein
VSVATVRTPAEYEERLRKYLFERAEEVRAVRVGEKEISERAEIVARYADLFNREQLDALRSAEEGAEGDEHELIFRLRLECEAGVADQELSERKDELENAILAARVTFQGEEIPLRTAQAKLAVLPDYAERDELGELQADASAEFNEGRRELIRDESALAGELSGITDPVARNEEEKGISLRDLAERLKRASDESAAAYATLRDRWFERLLGDDREERPSAFHVSYMRRLSPLEATYTKDRAVEVCMETLSKLGFDLANDSRIRLDLDDRPQKNPRACVIASDPPEVVHLITRAQGGIHDYQAFLHEAGHALHYAGCDPGLAYTFRRLSRDHALTEIYSFLVESITREPGWHAAYFGLDDEAARENAEATRFLEAILFRRYAAKLAYELELWGDFAHATDYSETYARRLLAATGVRYRADNYLDDLDEGFYSADYLRAWIRTAQVRAYLRAEVGDDWWARPETGDFLRTLFLQGTRPSSEDVAAQIGFEPLDTAPLLAELST